MDASYDFAIDGLKNMDASKLGEKTKLFGFEEAKYVFALKGFEHQNIIEDKPQFTSGYLAYDFHRKDYFKCRKCRIF